MYNADRDTVSSELLADTFAAHLATVQWRVRPVTLVPGVGDAIHPTLELKKETSLTRNCWKQSMYQKLISLAKMEISPLKHSRR